MGYISTQPRSSLGAYNAAVAAQEQQKAQQQQDQQAGAVISVVSMVNPVVGGVVAGGYAIYSAFSKKGKPRNPADNPVRSTKPVPFWWNEAHYLADYPGVAANVHQQFTSSGNDWFPSGWDHWDTKGRPKDRPMSWLPDGTPPPAYVTAENYIGYLMGGRNPKRCAKFRDAYTQQQAINKKNEIRSATGQALYPNVLSQANGVFDILGKSVKQADGSWLVASSGATSASQVLAPGTGAAAAGDAAGSAVTMLGIGLLLLKLFK